MPRIVRDVIRPSSQEFVEAAKVKAFGMSLEELERVRGGEGAWDQAGPGLDELDAMFKDNEGPFVLGSKISYADFVVLAMLEGFRRVGGDLYERIVDGREGLQGVWEGCEREGLLGRDD